MPQLNTVKSFLDRVLEHVPEDKKAGVRAEYSKAQDEVAAADQTLEDSLARVKETATAQTKWWETHKDVVTELKTLKEGGGGSKITDAVDRASLDKGLSTLKSEVLDTGLGLVTTIAQIGLNHQHEFGEVLNVKQLTDEAIKAGMTLQGYYDQFVAPKRQSKVDAAHKIEIDKAREEGVKVGVAETLKKIPGQGMPYPVGHSAPTTLDGLKKQPEGQTTNPYSLDAAVATANAEMLKAAGST